MLGVVRRIESSLAEGGFTLSRDSVAGRQTVIGRSSSLRRRTFVLVAVFKVDATPEHLDRFRAEADQYARTLTRGPGRATCTLAVAVVESARAAGRWGTDAGGPGGGYPTLVEVDRLRVTTPAQSGSGAAADPYLEQLVRDHVAAAVGRSGLP